MERFEKGTVVQLKRDVGPSALKGYLYLVTESNEDHAYYICMLPNTGIKIRMYYCSDSEYDKNFTWTSLNKDDVANGAYQLKRDDDGNYMVICSPNYKKKGEPINEKLTFDLLKSIFKYIPINYDGNEGFYYNGNFITKRTIYKKPKMRGRPTKNKPQSLKQVVITKCGDDNYVLKLFSEKVLRSQCIFKIKDYKISSKLFGFTESKKTMVGKVVEISKIEFQSDVKKSNKREDTVYIKVEDRNLRFSLEDIEIIYPNVNGWSEPKNRTIKKDSIVKLITNKDFKYIPKGTQVKVANIKDVGNKRYIGFIYDNKPVIGKIKDFRLV